MLICSRKSLRAVVFLIGATGGLFTAGAAMAAEDGSNFTDNSWTEVNGVWYPFCTNSADTGGGFGWQPELGGPNGGSCVVSYNNPGSNNNGGFASGTYYDGNGTAYPYCTNSADNGGGFGWQPELGGPNGGSCKINYNNGGNGGYNGGNGGYNGGNGGYNGGNGGYNGGNGGWHDDRGGWHDGRRGPVDVRVGGRGVGVRVGPVGVRVGRGGIGVRVGRMTGEETSPVAE